MSLSKMGTKLSVNMHLLKVAMEEFSVLLETKCETENIFKRLKFKTVQNI